MGKAFIFCTLLAFASASPLEDTPEVAAAKEAFMAAFAAAEAGEHAGLAPAQVATAYLADDAAVAEAKAAFMKSFAAAEAGEHAALAPAPVEALPVPEPVAPVATVAAPYFNGYYGYPYAHAAYAPYYHHAAAYPYAYGHYAGYPYVTVAAAKSEWAGNLKALDEYKVDVILIVTLDVEM